MSGNALEALLRLSSPSLIYVWWTSTESCPTHSWTIEGAIPASCNHVTAVALRLWNDKVVCSLMASRPIPFDLWLTVSLNPHEANKRLNWLDKVEEPLAKYAFASSGWTNSSEVSDPAIDRICFSRASLYGIVIGLFVLRVCIRISFLAVSTHITGKKPIIWLSQTPITAVR